MERLREQTLKSVEKVPGAVQESTSKHDEVTVAIENVGGIDDATVEFSPGVTLFVGRNATNRTSFLQAVKAGLGSDEASIKADAESAVVELSVGDETYTRTLDRGTRGTVASGTPYLEDATVAELFAFLLESNEARRAVVTGSDLRELIMRPVDTAEIEAEIDRLVDRRESLRAKLESIEDEKERLPELERKRMRIESQIEEKRAELESVEAEIESTDVSVEQQRGEQSALEDRLEELRQRRSELEDVRYELETERESRAALVDEREELEARRAELPEDPLEDADELFEKIRRRRERKQRLETELNELQNVIEFNEKLLDEADRSLVTEFGRDDEAVTDQLLGDGEISCWTCGSTVKRTQIESTIRRLRELRQTKVGDVDELTAEIDDIESKKQDRQRTQRERERVEHRLTEVETELEETETRIERLQERRTELTDAVESAEAAVEELEAEMENQPFADAVELHREANEIEYELGRLEADLDTAKADIEEVESQVDNQATVEEQLDEVTAEVESLRTKIDQIERDAVGRFNEHVAEVLDLLEYENLDRIWLERVEREVRNGRRTTTETAFDLHIVRTSADGTAYEDTVDHLSESEREVTGLVFALAGYLTHEVYEQVPFMLLDSLEAIDSERIAALVNHFADFADYLLVVLLPEDAAALPDRYDRVTEI
jgi:DNA repair exonuclease SbcCD ATPase subunit